MKSPQEFNTVPDDVAYQHMILQHVSRTYALTIPQLPEKLRLVVSNAYLHCRIADSIEDDKSMSIEQKKEYADMFIDVVRNNSTLTDVMLVKGNVGNGFIRFQDNDNSCNWTLGADDGSGLGANGFILYDRVNSTYRWSVDNS